MINAVIRGMVYLGSLLMVYNIYGFIRFARYVRNLKTWNSGDAILRVPIVLLIGFLLGYLAVGIFGRPDLIMAGILFGGSIFVFIMYKLLNGIVGRVVENERLRGELLAAEESNRVKTNFLDSMSHEMRTPMNVIIGQDAIILRDDSLKPDTRERLRKIDISAHHLLEIINDVLSMNYIESRDMRLSREPFDLREALELVDMLAQSRCEDKGLQYQSEVIGSVEGRCVGDSLRLRQILVNVLSNAVKFTPAGGTVQFITELTGGDGACDVRFTVSDTGVGIDPDYLPRIFETFSQENATSTDQYGGSGLGLSIAKKLVDMMGGDIAVSSVKGEGSTFVITLRFETVPCEPSAEPAPMEEPESLEGRHILIVEDIDFNAEMVADLLELEGMTSERAENGQIAVDMIAGAESHHFDAILMDLRMPVMDGLDATRAIRALDREDARTIPIIALTANTSDADVIRSLEAGMDVHLPKPMDSDLLYDTLRRQLTGKPRA